MAVAIKTPITMIQNCIAVSSNVSSLSAESSVAFSGNPVQQSVPQHSLRLWFFTGELIASFWKLLGPSHLLKTIISSLTATFNSSIFLARRHPTKLLFFLHLLLLLLLYYIVIVINPILIPNDFLIQRASFNEVERVDIILRKCCVIFYSSLLYKISASCHTFAQLNLKSIKNSKQYA